MERKLTDVRGIGPSTARALRVLGIATVSELAEAGAGKVAAARGLGEARAPQVIAAARALLDASDALEPAPEAPEPVANESAESAVETKAADDAPGEDQTAIEREVKEEKPSVAKTGKSQKKKDKKKDKKKHKKKEKKSKKKSKKNKKK